MKTADENRFFRDATLSVCGSLDMEKALWQSLLVIGRAMPADGLALSIYEREPGITRLIAGARVEGGMALATEIRQPAPVRRVIETWYDEPDRSSHVRVIEGLRLDPLTRPQAEAVGMPDWPAMLMRLKLEGAMLGSLIVINAQGRPYTPAQARLLSLLNEPFAVALSNHLRFCEVLKLKDLLADDNRYLKDELLRTVGEEIVGADFGLKGVMDLVRQVAPLSSPVLLLGETGTGKEVIASAIHQASARRDGPLIKVNCGALPEGLMDSELFGHEKGAFTGALTQKRGRFERADGGTIFLDEVGELSPEAQVRLLRVLQEREIERLGGAEPIRVDIRVIAATHRDLEAMLAQGRFREDLYFRLRVFPILIPPLRQRPADIPALVHYFIQKKSRELGLRSRTAIAPGTMEALLDYAWPGNVRELENAVERALILSRGGPLVFPDLGGRTVEKASIGPMVLPEEPLALNEVTARHIRRVLQMTRGRVHGPAGAARLLEVNPSTLRKRMKKLNIPFGRRSGGRADDRHGSGG